MGYELPVLEAFRKSFGHSHPCRPPWLYLNAFRPRLAVPGL